ncbi:MAG: hypothetical protein CME86_24430 [Herbaspirillum sp.]|nr:hypothetical protein [Herbaspirillum sp.]MBO17736.1 hypothetical protein [Herbaspirillum sp.]|tara:strand:+ start:2718 stop:4058 length:1341 start_codon:yes stop_codon:yes gene_type:complete
MGIFDGLVQFFRGKLPTEPLPSSSEIGMRTREDARYRDLYNQFFVDPELRAAIFDVRAADRMDGRIKKIHSRVARDIIKGGLVLQLQSPSPVISREWKAFLARIELNRPEKLKSDCRGMIMEGNLPLQVVMDEGRRIQRLIRMPAETIVPVVNAAGQFADVAKAYRQHDLVTGRPCADFALWQLTMVRFDADNYDDMGSMGRPYLDANRSTWLKLRMTEEDMVVRRRTRAPLRLAHVLEGANQTEMDQYEAKVMRKQSEITTDFFMNKKGAVNAIQGDSNLDQIQDVAFLLDCMFSGTPIPKGLAGYTEGLNRDILQDLKGDYFDEIDSLQDIIAFAYEFTFRLQLLLKGIVLGDDEIKVKFAERRTETPNQAADRALKLQALGIPSDMLWEELGFDVATVRARRDAAREEDDPYPDPPAGSDRPTVSITPGNGPKGSSATSISTK